MPSPSCYFEILMEIPKGFRTYLFKQSGQKRLIEERLINLFSRWGFREIIPPSVEYYKTLSRGMSDSDINRTFKFTESLSGKILALRSDITPQIVRTAAVHMRKVPRPLRFSYRGNVFRHKDPSSGERQEIFQSGVELIGPDSPEADAEMITIAVQALKEIGLTDFKISVGQVGFFKGIISDQDMSGTMREEVRTRIQKKDLSGLEELLREEGIDGDLRDNLMKLPTLIGGIDVLEKARNMSNNSTSSKALDNLEKVMEIVGSLGVEDHILIDLGEIRGLGYYTGVNFDGFVKEIGREVCGGGRYDGLHGSFGDPSPATGFAVDIDAVLEIVDRKGLSFENEKIDFLVMDFSAEKSKGIKLAMNIRQSNKTVARDIIKRTREASLSYARCMNVNTGILLGLDETGPDELIEVDIKSGTEKNMKIEEFLCRLQ